MSPLLASIAAPPAIALGCALGVVIGSYVERRGTHQNDGDVGLSESDRAAIEEHFGVHVSAVANQVEMYADGLADGDPLLRERLRLLERHPHRGDV